MKKFLVAILFVAMSFAIIGCGKTNEENVTSDDIMSEENTEVSEEVSEDASVDASEEVSEEVSEDVSEDGAVASDNAGVEILTNVWNAFAEEEKFPVMGGDYSVMVDGAPGAFDISSAENLAAMLYVPADLADDIDEGASLFHGMNLNTFTGAALHLTDASNADTFINALKENILGTQWMCGFPDTLVIFTVNDEYVVYAFGNVDAIASFKTKVTEVYGENAILVAEESLAG